MTSQIKIPLHQLDQAMVNDLQEKYPNSEVVLDLSPSRHSGEMSKQEFWQLITTIDWTKEQEEEQLLPLVEKLSKLSVPQIFAFDDILSELLYELDRKVFGLQIGDDAWRVDHYFSVDLFLYARACVIANGQELYNRVIKDPTSFPKNISYEALLYVGMEAYEKKTSQDYDYIAAYPIETYSNKSGWK